MTCGRQGVEVSTANTDFTSGGVFREARVTISSAATRPYRTLADMYLSVQNYPSANPRPYDDTGLDDAVYAQRNAPLRYTIPPCSSSR